MARFFAVAMSQAPGFSGMPVSGQRSSAVISASCARSSASPTSRTTRTRPPRSRADSIRQTASMAPRVAASLIAGPGSLLCLQLLLGLDALLPEVLQPLLQPVLVRLEVLEVVGTE